MTEATARKKVIAELEQEGYTCWFAAKAKYRESDIFGVFDVIAIKGSRIRFIQLTDYTSISKRRKKIQKFLDASGATPEWEIWGWWAKHKRFKKTQ